MTEAEWLISADPQPMLEFFRGKASERKLQLFAVACCRRHKNNLAIDVAEKRADSLATEEELAAARASATGPSLAALLGAADLAAAGAINYALGEQVLVIAHAEGVDPNSRRDMWRFREICDRFEHAAVRDPIIESERRAQTDLLRHFLGNPFRPYPAPEFWPSNVVFLAQALYEGQDCDYALHDALEEAGHPELAEHFRQREQHPKGCWMLDLILGKT